MPSGGFALGLVARSSRGVLLCYFFGPISPEIPTLASAAGKTVETAALVAKVGHLGIKNGTWPVLGNEPGWSRERWPMPVFVKHEELTGRVYELHYPDGDPNGVPRRVPMAADESAQGPEDGLMGYAYAARAVEKALNVKS
jgi:hypothetical protein